MGEPCSVDIAHQFSYRIETIQLISTTNQPTGFSVQEKHWFLMKYKRKQQDDLMDIIISFSYFSL